MEELMICLNSAPKSTKLGQSAIGIDALADDGISTQITYKPLIHSARQVGSDLRSGRTGS